jgi:hypothetical protein
LELDCCRKTLAGFLSGHLLFDATTASQYAHPTVAEMYRDGFEAALKAFMLRKFLSLVLLLDRLKSANTIPGQNLFVADASIKVCA